MNVRHSLFIINTRIFHPLNYNRLRHGIELLFDEENKTLFIEIQTYLLHTHAHLE